MDSVTVLDKDSDGIHFKNSIVHSSTDIKPAFSSVDTSASNGPSGTDAGATTNTSLPIFGCRAFVNFDGSDVATSGTESHCKIRASGNISKVVRTGTGEFTIDLKFAGFTPFSLVKNRQSTMQINHPMGNGVSRKIRIFQSND